MANHATYPEKEKQSVSELRELDLSQVKYWDRESNFSLGYEPKNIASGKRYRKDNKALLTTSARAQGFESSWWGTWRQWLTLGCKPRMGEKPARIYARGRYHCVWNMEQVSLPDEICEELQEAFEELMEIEQDRALRQGKMTRRDYQGWRWACIKAKQQEHWNK